MRRQSIRVRDEMGGTGQDREDAVLDDGSRAEERGVPPEAGKTRKTTPARAPTETQPRGSVYDIRS